MVESKEGIVVVEDLEFLRFDSNVGYLRRHKLNFHLRRALKKALKEDLAIVAADEEVARGLHRFYYVPVERIALKNDIPGEEFDSGSNKKTICSARMFTREEERNFFRK